MTSLTKAPPEYTPVAKIGDVEVGFGTTNPMLLAILAGQLIILVRWLLMFIFKTKQKEEEKRQEQMERLIGLVEGMDRRIHKIEHTMLTDSDIEKLVKVELYNQRKDKNQ
jgi:hypothetical protein